MNQLVDRSITPTKIITNIPFSMKYTENLNDNEFPMFDIYGNRKCPPAPPRNTKEIRICSCKQVYQIVLKTSPETKCGNCTHT